MKKTTFLSVFILFFILDAGCLFSQRPQDRKKTINERVLKPYRQHLNELIQDSAWDKNSRLPDFYQLFEKGREADVFRDFIDEPTKILKNLKIGNYLQFANRIWGKDQDAGFDFGEPYFCNDQDVYLVTIQKTIRGEADLDGKRAPKDISKWIRFKLTKDYKIISITESEEPPPDTDEDYVINDREQRCDICPKEKGQWDFDGCKDSDGDGVPDNLDDCPNSKGKPSLKGCPDRDDDNIADADDKCPDVKGTTTCNGCPDTDKDGLCDADDRCPDQRGSIQCDGCPDLDFDGLCGKEDLCPDDSGPQRCNGCPDSDKDGICDTKDACPNDYGTEACRGCPDTDNDGLCDNVDLCPGYKGKKEHQGCPLAPPAVFSISGYGGVAIPYGSFGDYANALNLVENTWENESGFADLGWQAGLSLDYTPSRFWGLGVQGGYLKMPFSSNDLERQIDIFLTQNNTGQSVVTASASAYQSMYLAGKMIFGFFKRPVGFRVEPLFGLLLSQNFDNRLITRVGYSNGQPDEVKTIDLLPENINIYGGNALVIVSFDKWGASAGATFLTGKFTASPLGITFASHASALTFSDIDFSFISPFLSIHYYLVTPRDKADVKK